MCGVNMGQPVQEPQRSVQAGGCTPQQGSKSDR